MMEHRVYFWHLKALGYCNRQMRAWCKSHSVSWRDLINNGIDADYLLSIDQSEMAHAAVLFAETSGWSPEPVSAEDKISERCV